MVQTVYLENRGLGVVSNLNEYVRDKFDINIHKAMIFTDDVYKINEKLFITVWPKNACKLEFS